MKGPTDCCPLVFMTLHSSVKFAQFMLKCVLKLTYTDCNLKYPNTHAGLKHETKYEIFLYFYFLLLLFSVHISKTFSLKSDTHVPGNIPQM